MSELIPYDPKLVKAIVGNSPADVLKPLKTSVFLFDSFIAGTSHLDDQAVLDEMKVGDILTMQREQNENDPNAILLKDGKGRKAGYIPARDNIVFARLMDAGKFLEADVREIEPRGHFWKIAIGISLVDF